MKAKIYKIGKSHYNAHTNSCRERIYEGTLAELIETFSYTLESGAAYAHEKGNFKINRKPKTAKSLVDMLIKADHNRALNGIGMNDYWLEC